MELTHQLTPADQPDVLPLRHFEHFGVDRADVTLNEPDVRSVDRLQRACREYPCRLLVRPGLRVIGVRSDAVIVDPLVRRRTPRQGPRPGADARAPPGAVAPH